MLNRTLKPALRGTAAALALALAGSGAMAKSPETTLLVVEPYAATAEQQAAADDLASGKARVWVPSVAEVRAGRVPVDTNASAGMKTVQPVGEIRYLYVDPRTGAQVAPERAAKVGAERRAYIVFKPLLDHNTELGTFAEQEAATTVENGTVPDVAEPMSLPAVLVRND